MPRRHLPEWREDERAFVHRGSWTPNKGLDNTIYATGRGALVFEVGYHPRKKIHVIRVVFQYARTSCTVFRGAKTNKTRKKKRCAFGHIDKLWKGHDGQIKKNTCKNTYLGSIFIPEKHMFRVCFESPFTRMISSLKYKCPPDMPATASCICNKSLERFSRNRQEEENTITFRLKCIVIA